MAKPWIRYSIVAVALIAALIATVGMIGLMMAGSFGVATTSSDSDEYLEMGFWLHLYLAGPFGMTAIWLAFARLFVRSRWPIALSVLCWLCFAGLVGFGFAVLHDYREWGTANFKDLLLDDH